MDSVIPSLTLKNACMMVENATFKITVEVLLSVDKNKNLKINLGVYNKMMSQDAFISLRSCNLTSFHSTCLRVTVKFLKNQNVKEKIQVCKCGKC